MKPYSESYLASGAGCTGAQRNRSRHTYTLHLGSGSWEVYSVSQMIRVREAHALARRADIDTLWQAQHMFPCVPSKR